MRLHVRTERLDDDRPLLELLDLAGEDAGSPPFVFLGGDVELVCLGSAHEMPVGTGDARGAQAWDRVKELLDDAEAEAEVAGRGTGPVVVGSLTFDPAAPGSFLRIPRLMIGRRGATTWVTTAGTAPGEAWRPPRDARPPSARWTSSASRPRFAGSSQRDDLWLGAVAAAVAAIGSGELEKVVLARDHRLWSEDPFDVPAILGELARRFPACRTFLADGLVGASPEPLLHVDGTLVRSRVLAGTAPRGASPESDARRWDDLLGSTKDRREHDMAVASIVAPLEAIGARVSAPAEPGRLALDNVQHLASEIAATLPDPVPALRLLDAIHPSAAVGGVPSRPALARIRATEGMDRGRYAGPVGWSDATGDGEWALALRCAEIDGARARLLAGAGIVAGSLPELELRETQFKLRAMLRVLEGQPAERAREATEVR